MTLQELLEAKATIYRYFTEEESLEAVRKDGMALQYVNKQTEAIHFVKEEQLNNQ